MAQSSGGATALLPLIVWRTEYRGAVSGGSFAAKNNTSSNAPILTVKPRTGDLQVNVSVDVTATSSPVETNEGYERKITPREMETTAGTFDDPSRFIQTLPGVTNDNDERNDFLVRGGNPEENGFVIDNIEIPSINQLALADTTGGFVSMLDDNAISRLTLHTDAYDSRFDQRLSSIVEISTRPEEKVQDHKIVELGIAGFGGSMANSFGDYGSYFISARTSVLQYVTDDIGLNGVPVYRNAYLRAENHFDSRNSWWGMSLTGVDKILIQPSATDVLETSTYIVDYSGWRNTTGLNWQHLFAANSFGVLSFGQSEQSLTMNVTDQLQADGTVYYEHSRDTTSTLKYDWNAEPLSFLNLNAGSRVAVDQADYHLDQPFGLLNIYSAAILDFDATNYQKKFAATTSSGYVEAAFKLPYQSRIVVGERVTNYALGGHLVSTPRALFSIPIFGRLAHVGYSEYAQLPPELYLLSYNNLRTLQPIRSRQFTGGIVLVDSHRSRITLEGYQKNYTDYPVSSEFRQLSTANVADTFGQAFLMFPMVAAGKGVGRGVELGIQSHLNSRFDLTAALTYARVWYSALDGILRKGNYDVPFDANLNGVYHIKPNLTLSARYQFKSGVVYTPDNLYLSAQQDRDIFDLTKINADRSHPYHRLDFRFEQSLRLGNGVVTWHAGLQNALSNSNFYSLNWGQRSNPGQLIEQDQLPIFPDGGVKYTF
jgi:hypothetical protein